MPQDPPEVTQVAGVATSRYVPHPRLFDYGHRGNECYCTEATRGDGGNSEEETLEADNRPENSENNYWLSVGGGDGEAEDTKG